MKKQGLSLRRDPNAPGQAPSGTGPGPTRSGREERPIRLTGAPNRGIPAPQIDLNPAPGRGPRLGPRRRVPAQAKASFVCPNAMGTGGVPEDAPSHPNRPSPAPEPAKSIARLAFLPGVGAGSSRRHAGPVPSEPARGSPLPGPASPFFFGSTPTGCGLPRLDFCGLRSTLTGGSGLHNLRLLKDGCL